MTAADWFRFLFEPQPAAGLAFTRLVLGASLLLDLVHERGLSRAIHLWDERCRFPVWGFDLRLSAATACAMYAIMAIALLGFIAGYHYRVCAASYAILYWVMLLQDRSRWNNHTYLFGLLALLFATNDSHAQWSVDAAARGRMVAPVVPYWQYFLLQFQIGLVYFYAGLKKTNPEWLLGYSMAHLSQLPVWAPVRAFGVPAHWIDYYLIHLGGFLFDISVAFLLAWGPTRPLAMLLCITFNLINSQMFRIGMFPWVMILLTPIFCRADWPSRVLERCRPSAAGRCWAPRSRRPVLVVTLVLGYVLLQLVLPFAFVALPGLNTWTAGIYGYNWDMMVHNWNHVHSRLTVRAVQPGTNRTVHRYLNPSAWTHNHRWAHHADMAKQLAGCVAEQLRRRHGYRQLQLYADVWASLNGRFAQRVYHPGVDLLTARWSVWQPTDWVWPILPRSEHWRRALQHHFGRFERGVRARLTSGAAALFLADNPGYTLQLQTGPRPVWLIVFDQTVRVRASGARSFLVVAANRSAYLPPDTLLRLESTGNGPAYFGLLDPA